MAPIVFFLVYTNANNHDVIRVVGFISHKSSMAPEFRRIGLLPGSIQAVVAKPRKYFVPSGGFGGFGVPAFTADGKLLGVFMLKIAMGAAKDAQSGAFSLNLSHMGVLPIILPVKDLKELADQAPEKPEQTPAPTPAPAATGKSEKSNKSEGERERKRVRLERRQRRRGPRGNSCRRERRNSVGC